MGTCPRPGGQEGGIHISVCGLGHILLRAGPPLTLLAMNMAGSPSRPPPGKHWMSTESH